MAQNYVLLERIELNASASSITLSNIPQTGYTDLKLVWSGRSTSSNHYDIFQIKFNGNASGYTMRRVYGTGSGTPTSENNSLGYINGGYNSDAADTASTFGNAEIYIPNYTSSNYKSLSSDFVTENNATFAIAGFNAGLWSNTAAITSITLTSEYGSFAQYSSLSLYGLAAVGTTPVIAPKASGGNITTDGTYWIHTFLATDTFTPFTGLTCDYLVVAGGGGGSCGGGGAGGYLSGSALSVTAQAYSITVGSGGAGAFNDTNASNGTNSIFSTITSTGGGGGAGGASGSTAGLSGGSGGGAGAAQGATTVTASGGSASPSGQGNAGGSITSVSRAGGGGGGASAVGGSTSTNSTGGNGGSGSSSSITGSAVTRAGGGGAGGASTAGTAGSGGGGAGGTDAVAATSGTANTGSGGGGGRGLGSTQNGGSGIVIIRYTIA